MSMTAQHWSERIFVMPTTLSEVIEHHFDPRGPNSSMRMATRESSWQTVSWSPAPRLTAGDQVQVVSATILDLRTEHVDGPLVLVDCHPIDRTRIFDLTPQDSCPRPGTVIQVCDLIKDIESDDLRRFLATIFMIEDVFRHYWTCPASLRHHHSHPGGLAVHSLEVALAAGNTTGLSDSQRDLAIAYALLHDLGKIWSYSEGELTRDARVLGHEHLGFERMLPALRTLREDWTENGRILQSLLSGEWKRDRQRPASAIGAIVRAMDQFSTEQYIRNVKG